MGSPIELRTARPNSAVEMSRLSNWAIEDRVGSSRPARSASGSSSLRTARQTRVTTAATYSTRGAGVGWNTSSQPFAPCAAVRWREYTPSKIMEW
jgi:hypothetical protein